MPWTVGLGTLLALCWNCSKILEIDKESFAAIFCFKLVGFALLLCARDLYSTLYRAGPSILFFSSEDSKNQPLDRSPAGGIYKQRGATRFFSPRWAAPSCRSTSLYLKWDEIYEALNGFLLSYCGFFLSKPYFALHLNLNEDWGNKRWSAKKTRQTAIEGAIERWVALVVVLALVVGISVGLKKLELCFNLTY